MSEKLYAWHPPNSTYKSETRRQRKAKVRLARFEARNQHPYATRKVRRARWAADGHDRKSWKPSIPVTTIYRAAWEAQNAAQRKLDRELKKNGVLSTMKDVALRIMAAFAAGNSKKVEVRRHQAR